jgi:hypothetical protein
LDYGGGHGDDLRCGVGHRGGCGVGGGGGADGGGYGSYEGGCDGISDLSDPSGDRDRGGDGRGTGD